MKGLTGERVVAGAFAAFGLFFAIKALGLKYMDGFAPGSGFLPFWLGLGLFALGVGFIASTRNAKGDADALPAVTLKGVSVALGLVACVALMKPIGFAVSMGAYLLFLVRVLERRGWVLSLGLALGTTAALYVVFRVWLDVPLPRGPWGF